MPLATDQRCWQRFQSVPLNVASGILSLQERTGNTIKRDKTQSSEVPRTHTAHGVNGLNSEWFVFIHLKIEIWSFTQEHRLSKAAPIILLVSTSSSCSVPALPVTYTPHVFPSQCRLALPCTGCCPPTNPDFLHTKTQLSDRLQKAHSYTCYIRHGDCMNTKYLLNPGQNDILNGFGRPALPCVLSNAFSNAFFKDISTNRDRFIFN